MSITLEQLMAEGAPVSADDIRRFTDHGYWQGRTIREVLRDVARLHPEREALIGYRSDGEVPRWTYRDLDEKSSHAAGVLAELGVDPGDGVAVMLPNWIEYGALIFGINELGGIYTGIPVSYGERQVEAILQRSGAKVLVVPRAWRSVVHLDLARRMRERLPTLERILVLGDDGSDLVDGEHSWSDFTGLPARSFEPRSSQEVCYLGFTSGTTGEPKGAMHTHDTLLHSAFQLAEHIGPDEFGDPMVHLVASPTGHHTGFVWGVVFTACLGGTGVHVDRWDPSWGVDVIRREGVTTFFGAPTFVQDMMRTGLVGDPDCPLTCLVVAGSSVPRGLPAQASAAFGAYMAPAWGMTECSIIISATPREPDEILATDGSVFVGSDVAVRTSDGEVTTEPDVPGELVVRGPSLFVGYYQRPDATADSFLPDGWFRTGDLATLDERGWVTLHGRSKDIIIRGGENVPVAEIETLLFDHSDVIHAAVVGVPDERLGERACAVLVLATGSSLDHAAVCDYLLARGLSKHFLPESLVLLDEMPMTQSGKVQKFRLRDLVSGT